MEASKWIKFGKGAWDTIKETWEMQMGLKVEPNTDSVLKNEGQDRRAELRIVAKLFQVAAVLSFCPHGHLDEAHQGEKRHRQTLSHQSEAQPRTQLVSVIRTGDEQEDPGEGVFSRIRDLPRLRSWWPEISQGNMDGKVSNLTKQENNEGQSDLLFSVNWRRVQRVVDVISHPSSKSPVICAVLEDVAERHRPMGEAMNKQCF